jgi:catechol 2,3-dioxygenase-like lactoylglutathione lyase family enzyme
VQVRGVIFIGTATAQRHGMGGFVRDVLGFTPLDRPDMEADTFRLEDGTCFAIASPGGMGPTERSIGFLVDDLKSAVVELRSAGCPVDEIATNLAERYVHFIAPDGQTYELIERLPDGTGALFTNS